MHGLLAKLVLAAAADTFDYIVVGGGPAGSVVASRLAAADRTVLLLEAGPPSQHELGGTDKDESPPGQPEFANLNAFDVPLQWDQIAFGDAKDKARFAAYEWDIQGASMAKALGGCGVHNGMLYLRGMREDFAEWPAGWQYEDVLPYFLRAENNTEFAGRFHSGQGPQQVSSATCGTAALREATMGAFREAGHGDNADFNGPSRDGVGIYQFNIRDGIRDSAAAAYLRQVQGRQNLRVLTGAEVSRVLFAGSRATGVEYYVGAALEPLVATLRPQGEVLLAAGALNTPKLLLLSGVGARAAVDPDVDVVAEVPGVGDNLQDAAMAVVKWELRDGVATGLCKTPAQLRSPRCARERALYAAGRRAESVFASAGISLGAFMTSNVSRAIRKPDIQVTVLPFDVNWAAGPAWMEQHNVTGEVVSWSVSLNTVESRGQVRLDAACTPRWRCGPVQSANYFDAGKDLAALSWAIEEVRRVARGPSLAGLLKRELLAPGVSTVDGSVDDWIRCGPAESRAACGGCCTMVVNHFVGTCRMGSLAAGAVVDPQLRVHGVEGLRVVDASVMPALPSGNTHATVVMIAEKAAALLLDNSNSVVV